MDLQIRNRINEGLKKIQTEWNKMRDEKDLCLDNFREWRICRRRTLRALQKFQDEFDKIHQCSNAGRVVGNGAALLGSLATIVGFGLSFSKDLRPIGKELMEYGSTVGTIGGTATFTTFLVECGFNMRVLNDVKATLEKDKRQTEELLGWFQGTKRLSTHLKEVFGCGILNIDDILKAFRELSVIQFEGGKALKKVQSYLSALIADEFSAERLPQLDNKELEKIFIKASYQLKQLFLEFCNNSEVRRAILEISYSFRKNPILFDLCKISIRIIGELAVQNIAFTSYVSSFGDKSLMELVNSPIQGILRAINVVLSVLAVLAAINNLKNGKSEYSKMVEETHKYLSVELEALDSYPMLRG